MLDIIYKIATFIGLCVLVITAIIVLYVLFSFITTIVKRIYSSSYLYWVINTYRLRFLKNDKIVSDADYLIHMKRQIEISCPKKFQKKWVDKVDQKLQELRDSLFYIHKNDSLLNNAKQYGSYDNIHWFKISKRKMK